MSGRSLRSSVLAMYGLKIAEYLLPLISVPYLVRTLGPGGFGQLAYAQSFAQIFVVLTDYGMALTGTRMVSRVRDDKGQCRAIFSAITTAKLFLLVISASVFSFLVQIQESDVSAPSVMWASFLFVVGNCLLPIWFLQGIEALPVVAGAMVIARLLGITAVFLFVHSPSDVTRAALANSAVPVIAGSFLLTYLAVKGRIGWRLPTTKEVREVLRLGRSAFGSSVAITTYNLATPILVGNVAGQLAVGLYSAAEKVVKLATNGLSPVFQALFPRISYELERDERNALRLLRRFGMRMIVLSAAASLTLAFGAQWIVLLLFGEEFQGAVKVLQIMSPLPFIITFGNLLGNQLLFNLGRMRQFGTTYYIAAFAFLMAVIPTVQYFSALGGAASVLLAETCVLIQFGYLVYREGISPFSLVRFRDKRP